MTDIVFIERAPAAGAEHRLDGGATIGREDCDVQLADSDVSRRHAVLRVEGLRIAVEDLGSTNGTFVNDSRIEGVTELRDGDRLRFGGVVWELRMPIQATRVAPIAEGHQEPARDESRGDVPKPELAPSPVPQVGAASGAAPEFSPSGGRFKRSAARRLEATVISYGVVAATAVAIAAYFAQR